MPDHIVKGRLPWFAQQPLQHAVVAAGPGDEQPFKRMSVAVADSLKVITEQTGADAVFRARGQRGWSQVDHSPRASAVSDRRHASINLGTTQAKGVKMLITL